jgi:UDP-glucose 4-epimerase
LYHKLYYEVYGIQTSILRLTNTIGPRMRIKDARQTFLGVWIKKLLLQEPIEVWGGDQLRDFNDVDDVVDALLLTAATTAITGERPMNLGGNTRINLKDLADLLIQINGSGSRCIKEYPSDRKKIDIGDYYSSYQLFQEKTHWKPARSLEETLARTLRFYKDYGHLYLF